MNFLFLSSYLGVGGAERQLLALARQLRRRGHESRVAVFYGGGEFERAFEEAGVPLVQLGKRGPWDVPGSLSRLVAAVDATGAEVLHGYLTVPNIYSAWVKRRRPGVRVAWGVRATETDPSRFSRLHRFAMAMEARLASRPDAIIANSNAARQALLARGFPAARTHVVHNGIDSDAFRPDPAGRQRMRREWGVAPDQVLVGMAARIDPIKDHGTFLRAAEIAATADGRLRFVIVGDGPREIRASLEAGAGPRTRAAAIWAGARSDMTAAYGAMDIGVLSSVAEGFPNAVAEAMACERPCVVTDVGDSALLVGETGRIVPARSPEAMAGAILALAALGVEGRAALGRAARARIECQYGLDTLADRTLQVLSVPPASAPATVGDTR